MSSMKTILPLIVVLSFTGTGFAQEPKSNPKQAIEHLMERARDARAAGRADEAKELAAQAEKLQHAMREHEGARRPEKHPEGHGPMPGKHPEAERMEHVMQAVQHLHAAGLHKPAEEIEGIARNMRREIEERMKHEQAEARGREGHRNDGKPHPEMEEMRQQMRRMAEQIEKLQMEMKKRGE